jgi:hypothetical protein
MPKFLPVYANAWPKDFASGCDLQLAAILMVKPF